MIWSPKMKVVSTVIIENQLEKSNHDHLGKIITYLTGLDAKTAIWIVSEPRPEHVAAIAWLNESNSASFYIVKVEAFRIGDSPAAPLFTLIVGPSDETKEVGKTKKEFAERHNLRKQWWTQLIDRSSKVNRLHAHLSPSTYSAIGTSAGIRGLNLNYIVGREDCAVELYIDRGKDEGDENKRIFDQLAIHKSEIEKAFGEPLLWQRLDGKRASRIRFTRSDGGYRSEEDLWADLQDTNIQDMDRLEKSVRPYLRELKLKS